MEMEKIYLVVGLWADLEITDPPTVFGPTDKENADIAYREMSQDTQYSNVDIYELKECEPPQPSRFSLN